MDALAIASKSRAAPRVGRHLDLSATMLTAIRRTFGDRPVGGNVRLELHEHAPQLRVEVRRYLHGHLLDDLQRGARRRAVRR